MQGTYKISTLLISFILASIGVSHTAMANDGLHNSGFEDGLASWVVNTESDVVTVAGTEGPADSTTYADKKITVDPYIGQYMLRLGSPKNVNEQQNRGDNNVSQSFVASSSTVLFSFRLFSWEHRGDDTFSFDLKDDSDGSVVFDVNNGAFSLKTGTGPATSCPQTPCSFPIDVGRRGNFLDSGWVVVELSGLNVGGSYTISYNIAGGGNEALGSWGYFDNVNNPPIARFNFSPNAPTSDTPSPLESDTVQFVDGSYDPDEPNDEIVRWTWTISGPDIPTQTINVQNPIFQFPNDGIDYTVTLEVEDSFGAIDSVSAGNNASDGTAVPELIIFDAAARVNALNFEVLVGEEFTLFGRFFDPGAADTHTASWMLGGIQQTGSVIEENEPMLSSGTVLDLYTFTESPASCVDVANEAYCELSSSLTVFDAASGTSTTDDFTIRIYSAIDQREINDGIDTAKPLESGWSYLSSLGIPGDVDVFKVVLPDNASLKAGSEILIRLMDVPADYDLVILSTGGSATQDSNSYQTAPYNILPYNILPYNILPYNILPYNILPYNILPYNILPYNILPYNILPYNILPYNILPYNILPYNILSPYENFGFFDAPLSHLGFTPSFQTNLTGTDIGLAELGLDSLNGAGANIINHSVNRGFGNEEILIRVDSSDKEYYIVVVGNNGVFNIAPYTLQIETSIPVEREVLLGDLCDGTPVVAAANSTSNTAELYSSGTNTLIVTQEQRMRAIYGDAAWDGDATRIGMYQDLVSLANEVGGTIVSLPSTIYDSWDSKPCNVDEANLVADAIQTVIMTYADAEYVVLAGSDNLIPSRRVPDETTLSNERMYASSAFLKPQSPLAASIAEGYMLTDDFYVDPTPISWQGRELYLPKRSIGRLVEKPSEISTTIQAFLNSNGEINDALTDATAMVTGYDFFSDGATLSLTFLSNSFVTDDAVQSLLISNTWNADDLRCNLLGDSSSGMLNCITHNISNFNAHMSHYAALSPTGFYSEDLFAASANELVTGSDVANAGGLFPALSSKLLYTIGCHAGMNVPDNDALSPEFFGLLSDPRLDFAQAMAQQGSVYVASTGYGIGDDAGIAGTEGLMAMYSQELARGGTVGNALMQAKLNYYGSLLSPTAYDEKSLVQTVLYGLPMYRVNVSGGATGIPVNDEVMPGNVTLNPALVLLNIPDTGNYYAVSGLSQSTAGRPLQPKQVMDIILGPGERANGVLLLSGNYEDEDGFDPVISRPAIEWETNITEPKICLNALWPSVISEINTIQFPDSIQQKLVVTPGQFRCNSQDASGNAIGVQRIYNNVTLNILSSTNNSDQQAPQIHEVDIHIDQNGFVTVTVHADDNVGVDQIVIAIFDNGTITSVVSGTLTGPGPYTIDLGVISANSKLVTQTADAAGYVSTWTGKGANVRAIMVDAGTDQTFSTLTPTTLTGTVEGFSDLLKEAEDITYVWDFDDGQYDSDPLAKNGQPIANFVTVDQNGKATFSVTHQYSVTNDVNPTLKVTGGFGGIGVDDVQLRHCGDSIDLPGNPNLDLVACSIDNSDSTNISIQLSVAGGIADDMQFRLFIDHSGTAKNSDPDGKADEMLKYQGGTVTGMKSLVVTPQDLNGDGIDETLRFDFDLSNVKWRGTRLQWYAETQDGVAGGQSIGHADSMPDTGFFGYTIH